MRYEDDFKKAPHLGDRLAHLSRNSHLEIPVFFYPPRFLRKHDKVSLTPCFNGTFATWRFRYSFDMVLHRQQLSAFLTKLADTAAMRSLCHWMFYSTPAARRLGWSRLVSRHQLTAVRLYAGASHAVLRQAGCDETRRDVPVATVR